MVDVALGLARPDELAAVGEATVAAYAPFLLGPDDPYAARLRDAPARAREAELWVARGDDGRVLGSVTACPPGSPWRELADADDPEQGEFRMLAVDPAAQGRGVGEALVQHAVARAVDHGARRVLLSTLPDMAGAHRLYERLGFTRAPALDWTPVPHVRLLAYRLDLQEPR